MGSAQPVRSVRLIDTLPDVVCVYKHLCTSKYIFIYSIINNTRRQYIVFYVGQGYLKSARKERRKEEI